MSALPGPWHTRYTDTVLLYHELRGTRWWYIQNLHARYGAIVRIAPDEVAISDPELVSKVHGIGTPFKKKHQPRTPLNIFSMSNPKTHRLRRRFYTRAFSEDNISINVEPVVRQLAACAMAGMKEEALRSEHSTADIYKWCMFYGNDVSHEVVFGNACTKGIMSTGGTLDDVIIGGYLQKMIAWARFCLPVFLLGRWLSCMSPYLRSIFLVEWRYARLLDASPVQRDFAARTIFVKGAKHDQEKDRYSISDHISLGAIEIAHDSATFLGAGGEATGVTLVFLLWQIMRIPKLQADIKTELASLAEPLLSTDIAKLPILDAVIYETLRLYGGGGSYLPRYAPIATVLGGYDIPADTAVTTHHGALHRNPTSWINATKCVRLPLGKFNPNVLV